MLRVQPREHVRLILLRVGAAMQKQPAAVLADARVVAGRERVARERLAADRRRLEQREPLERALEPGRIRLNDPAAVDEQPNRGPLAAARRVSERLDHRLTVARRGAEAPLRKSTLPM